MEKREYEQAAPEILVDHFFDYALNHPDEIGSVTMRGESSRNLSFRGFVFGKNKGSNMPMQIDIFEDYTDVPGFRNFAVRQGIFDLEIDDKDIRSIENEKKDELMKKFDSTGLPHVVIAFGRDIDNDHNNIAAIFYLLSIDPKNFLSEFKRAVKENIFDEVKNKVCLIDIRFN